MNEALKTATTTLVLCVISLLALGMVMLYSSSMADKGTHYLQMQIVWCSIGFLCCATATAVDYRKLKIFALPILIVAVALLALVLAPQICCAVALLRMLLGAKKRRAQCAELRRR